MAKEKHPDNFGNRREERASSMGGMRGYNVAVQPWTWRNSTDKRNFALVATMPQHRGRMPVRIGNTNAACGGLYRP